MTNTTQMVTTGRLLPISNGRIGVKYLCCVYIQLDMFHAFQNNLDYLTNCTNYIHVHHSLFINSVLGIVINLDPINCH